MYLCRLVMKWYSSLVVVLKLSSGKFGCVLSVVWVVWMWCGSVLCYVSSCVVVWFVLVDVCIGLLVGVSSSGVIL